MSQRVSPKLGWSPGVRLTSSQSGSGLVSSTDLPPIVADPPDLSFFAGTPAIRDLSIYVTDDARSAVVHSLSGTLTRGFSFDANGLLSYDGTGEIVETDGSLISKFKPTEGGVCYAGIRFTSSGLEYENTDWFSSFGTVRNGWLSFGDPGEVWVERTIIGGVLNWLDEGAGRLPLSVNRTYGIVAPMDSPRFSSIRFDFYDQATGGNLIHTRNQDFTAEVFSLS